MWSIILFVWILINIFEFLGSCHAHLSDCVFLFLSHTVTVCHVFWCSLSLRAITNKSLKINQNKLRWILIELFTKEIMPQRVVFWLLCLIIIIMCQVCCRHRWSWPSNPLCRQFSWWAHCWEILFLLRNYSDCVCILCVVFVCLWYHKSFHSIFVFLLHQLYLYVLL